MKSPSGYHNAKDVLPPAVLAEVQRHVAGHLWVPPAARASAQVRQRVVQLHRAGVRTADIAALLEVSVRRVQQIVRAAREAASDAM